jgi:prepilin peptidase CpaA
MKMDLSITSNKLIIVTVVGLALLAMYLDLRWRRIPNYLTFPAIALGFLLNFLGNSWNGLIFSFFGLLVGMGLLILPYLLGGMGGGDVKFLGTLGAMLGSYSVLNIFLYATLIGGAIAVVVAIVNKSLIETLKKVWLLLKCIFLFRAPLAGAGLFKKSLGIPYGLAIGAGAFLYLTAGKIV